MPRRRSTLKDTIVAQATPPGVGAVAMIRVSGPGVAELLKQLSGGAQLPPSHRLVRRNLIGLDGDVLDEAMVCLMLGPRSFTGEDVLELHLHGGRAVLGAVLERCKGLGARQAEPGEFTERAFANGRLDLAQAEAIADLIAAEDESERKRAVAQLGGNLSHEIRRHLEGIEGVLAGWQASLDFPEDVGDVSGASLAASCEVLKAAAGAIGRLVAAGRSRQQGPRQVALCGAPNVGKSSLLNRWAGFERVLVDEQAGTTRDAVAVKVGDGRVAFTVWDTAGYRRTPDQLEARGIELGLRQARDANLVLWLVDPSDPVWPGADHGECVVVGGKADRLDSGTGARATLERDCAERGHRFWGWISTADGEGVEALRRYAEGTGGRAGASDLDEGSGVGAVVVRERQLDGLRAAQKGLGDVLQSLSSGRTPLDLVAMDLQECHRALGQVLGVDADAQVLDRVFSEFCIGK